MAGHWIRVQKIFLYRSWKKLLRSLWDPHLLPYKGISNTTIDVNDLKMLRSLEGLGKGLLKGFPVEEGLSMLSVFSQVP